MFDRVEIRVRSGDGGDGAISFRREKFVPYGGPDGGDGGKGGDVLVRADASVSSLLGYRQKRSYRAKDGGKGGARKMHGRNGKSLLLLVPPGTLISQKNHNGETELLADLEKAGQEQAVVRGGKGGAGNTHYATSTYQAPQIAQGGETGEEKTLLLEMRLIADVGIIGYPNAGKSTLLATASAAKPKIASYPFTTLEPVLGVVEIGRKSFIMADIPGLIEGAHLGRGLGHDFLRHIMRTRVLVHLLDGGSADPVLDMNMVNEELAMFDPALARKPQLVAVNKIDLPDVQDRIKTIGADFKAAGVKVHFISAQTGQGVAVLLAEALKVLDRLTSAKEEAPPARKVFRPGPRKGRVSVRRDGDEFVIEAPELERLMTRDSSVSNELRYQLKAQLNRLGAAKLLEKAGIKRGDRVRCGNLSWEW